MPSVPTFFDPLLRGQPDQLKFLRNTIPHLHQHGFDADKSTPIYQLMYKREGIAITATVGGVHQRPGGDFIEFIFKSQSRTNLFYICGPYSGVWKGNPVMVGDTMDPQPTYFR